MAEQEQIKEQVDSFEFTWDFEAEAGYLYLTDSDRTSEVTTTGNGVGLDFGSDDSLKGIEFITRSSLPDELRKIVEQAE